MEAVTGKAAYIAAATRIIALCAHCSLIKVWDLQKGKIQHTLSGHTDEIEVLIYRADGCMVETVICGVLHLVHLVE